MSTFADLPLIPALHQAIAAAGYEQPTPIQSQSLPAILAGRDLIAQAPTGSGKTAAFGLGLLQRLEPSSIAIQALVLCPTRELAGQVAQELRRLAVGIPNIKLTLLTGGVPVAVQLASLGHAPHIIVGTPGRVEDLLRRQALGPAAISMLVLDEADRMLDMGFEEVLNSIIGQLPRSRQTLLFSATWPDAIRELGRRTLRNPLEVLAAGNPGQPVVEQTFYEVASEHKGALLGRLLLTLQPESAVVFCNTRRDVQDLQQALAQLGFASAALHGEMEQRDRDEVLLCFANRSLRVLVASDVAARGLDVKELACVVNYELPGDPDVYLHRIGRTARAGSGGLVLNLVAPREIRRALELEDHLGLTLRWDTAPTAAPTGKVPAAAMCTLRIEAGRSDKLRPGDILGALTGAAGLEGAAIGKIDVLPTRSYVAIRREQAGRALDGLRTGRIKGRNFRVRRL